MFISFEKMTVCPMLLSQPRKFRFERVREMCDDLNQKLATSNTNAEIYVGKDLMQIHEGKIGTKNDVGLTGDKKKIQ